MHLIILSLFCNTTWTSAVIGAIQTVPYEIKVSMYRHSCISSHRPRSEWAGKLARRDIRWCLTSELTRPMRFEHNEDCRLCGTIDDCPRSRHVRASEVTSAQRKRAGKENSVANLINSWRCHRPAEKKNKVHPIDLIKEMLQIDVIKPEVTNKCDKRDTQRTDTRYWFGVQKQIRFERGTDHEQHCQQSANRHCCSLSLAFTGNKRQFRVNQQMQLKNKKKEKGSLGMVASNKVV